MNKLLITWLFMAVVSVVYAQENDYGSILRQLDEAIELSPETVAQYEQQTEGVYRQYQNARTPEEKYGLAFQLYEQYKAFMNDSALHYLSEAERWAEEQGNDVLVGNCRALMAFQCSTVGYYNEALAFLHRINKKQLDSTGLQNYYQSQMHVYGELGRYSFL